MNTLTISVRSNLKQIERSLSAFAYKQVPFATAQALTTLAKQVKEAEVKNLSTHLDRPTPFTLRSMGIKRARKGYPEAVIFVKDIQARYLTPVEFGGKQVLNSKAVIRAVHATLNQYGNIPRTALARIKGRTDVFIGPVKGRAGIINGVWQRLPPTKGKPASLKLIFKFEDARPVKPILGYHTLAKKIITANFNKTFGQALAKAIATAN